jgi:hypothetical protein
MSSRINPKKVASLFHDKSTTTRRRLFDNENNDSHSGDYISLLEHIENPHRSSIINVANEGKMKKNSSNSNTVNSNIHDSMNNNNRDTYSGSDSSLLLFNKENKHQNGITYGTNEGKKKKNNTIYSNIHDMTNNNNRDTITNNDPPLPKQSQHNMNLRPRNSNINYNQNNDKPKVQRKKRMQNEIIEIEDSSSEDECNTTTPNEPPTSTAALCTEVAGVGNVNSQLFVVRNEPPMANVNSQLLVVRNEPTVANVNSQLLVVRNEPPVANVNSQLLVVRNEPPVANVNSQLLVVRQVPPAPSVEFSYAALANADSVPVPQTTLMIDVADINVAGTYWYYDYRF